MEHRIKAPSNKSFIATDKGGTSSITLNPRKNYVNRMENLHPYAPKHYLIDLVKNENTLEHAITVKNKKEEDDKQIEIEKKRKPKNKK